VPKNVAFEDILDKCTQLGVQEIIPLVTERTFWDRESVEKKSSRFERVLRRAGKQSGALFLPQLKPAMSFREFLAQGASYGLRLIPNLAEGSLTLSQALTEKKEAANGRILIVIGPEGDFTDKELKAAFGAGFKGITLGDSVLRVDTAAIASVGFIRLFFEA
jgi:16S rRNA (uracil1498-N3)-methyltransferase